MVCSSNRLLLFKSLGMPVRSRHPNRSVAVLTEPCFSFNELLKAEFVACRFDLLNAAEFQRLRRIRQLGMASLAYPVYYLAASWLVSLRLWRSGRRGRALKREPRGMQPMSEPRA